MRLLLSPSYTFRCPVLGYPRRPDRDIDVAEPDFAHRLVRPSLCAAQHIGKSAVLLGYAITEGRFAGEIPFFRDFALYCETHDQTLQNLEPLSARRKYPSARFGAGDRHRLHRAGQIRKRQSGPRGQFGQDSHMVIFRSLVPWRPATETARRMAAGPKWQSRGVSQA